VKRTKFKRFAYVPIGETFRIGPGGTVDFTKINEDQARTPSGGICNFELYERCAWPLESETNSEPQS
jgi:hypothetical protein